LTSKAGRIAEKFRVAEAAAFVSGDGAGKPKGFLDYGKVANASVAWGSLGYVATGSAGGFGASADSLIDLVYALEAPYRANGTFIMNSKTTGLVRKLKDRDGRFFWSDGIAAGQPARLLGYPVLILEAMPEAPDTPDVSVRPRSFVAPVPVYPVLMDLPILRDAAEPQAPYLAVTARPWPGAAAIYASSEDAGYEFERLSEDPSSLGLTTSVLAVAPSGRFDWKAKLQVVLTAGELT